MIGSRTRHAIGALGGVLATFVVTACASTAPIPVGLPPLPAPATGPGFEPIGSGRWLDGLFDRGGNPACTAAIPPSRMVPTTAYLAIRDTTELPVHVRPFARALTSAIARRVRMGLGGTADSVPLGAPRVTWQGAAGRIRLTAYRDGRFDRPDLEGDSVLNAGLGEVLSGLSAVIASGEVPAWPAALPDSSITLTVQLFTPMVSRGGRVWGLKPHVLHPLFDVMHPPMEPAKQRVLTGPKYPGGPKIAGVMGRFEFTYVVDTTGRIDMTTVQLHKEMRRPVGSKDAEYRREFLESLLTYFRGLRLEPALIDDCKVRQRLEQAYEFRLG